MQAQAQDMYFVLRLCWDGVSQHSDSIHASRARRAGTECCMGAVCPAAGVVCPAAAAAWLLRLC